MESKGRRAPRAPGLIEIPAGSAKPVENSAVAGPVEVAADPPKPVETLAEAAKPAETALNHAAADATSASQPSTAVAYFGRDALAALAQSQAAMARGLEALSAEMAGLALSGIDTATRTATKMLAVKTFSDAIDVNTGFTCSSLDTLVGGSAKLSEIGVKLAAETSQPILTQLGKGWIKASRVGS